MSAFLDEAVSPESAMDGEPRWLDADERRLWLRLVGLTTLLPGALEVQLKRDAGLSLFEYHVLAMLSEADGHARLMSDLAFWSNSSLSRLSHVVKRLESQGWVRREACLEDGRATNAVLTAKGAAHLEEHAPAHVDEVRRIVYDGLSPDEVRTAGEVLGKIFERVDPARLRQTES